MPNIVMTPHVAAFAPEAQSAGALLLQRNIELFLSGQPVLTPVPELTARTIATDNAAVALGTEHDADGLPMVLSVPNLPMVVE